MLAVVFTLDYEIYGNGKGSLRELVLDPTEQLADLFRHFNAPLVIFVEALEFAKIEEYGSDDAIDEVATQLRRLRSEGHEIALHLHPWWANARYEDRNWHLDWSERNICALSPARIRTIVGQAIAYLRRALDDPEYAPRSYRGGSWLMQPTEQMAHILLEHGVCVDSSVFKGGRVRNLGLDYRPALRNGSWWPFSSDVNVPDNKGKMIELPIYTEMVPFWKMLKSKRLRIQRRVPSSDHGAPLERRWADFLRIRYPRKFDFCRMTASEMCAVVEQTLALAGNGHAEPRPIVAIGHTKDLVDFKAIQQFLAFLQENSIAVKTFLGLLADCQKPPLAS